MKYSVQIMSDLPWNHQNDTSEKSYSTDSLYSFEELDFGASEKIQKILNEIDNVVFLKNEPSQSLPGYLLNECEIWKKQFAKKFTIDECKELYKIYSNNNHTVIKSREVESSLDFSKGFKLLTSKSKSEFSSLFHSFASNSLESCNSLDNSFDNHIKPIDTVLKEVLSKNEIEELLTENKTNIRMTNYNLIQEKIPNIEPQYDKKKLKETKFKLKNILPSMKDENKMATKFEPLVQVKNINDLTVNNIGKVLPIEDGKTNNTNSDKRLDSCKIPRLNSEENCKKLTSRVITSDLDFSSCLDSNNKYKSKALITRKKLPLILPPILNDFSNGSKFEKIINKFETIESKNDSNTIQSDNKEVNLLQMDKYKKHFPSPPLMYSINNLLFKSHNKIKSFKSSEISDI